MTDPLHQQINLAKSRKLARLDQTRQHIAKLAAKRAARPPKPKITFVRITIRIDQKIRDRANAACLALEGVPLLDALRATILSYADTPDSEIPCLPPPKRRDDEQPPLFLPQDQDWGQMVRDYVAELPRGSEITLAELFDMMDVPQQTRDRASEMMLGRVLRRLKFFKKRVLRDRERISMYVKPLDY